MPLIEIPGSEWDSQPQHPVKLAEFSADCQTFRTPKFDFSGKERVYTPVNATVGASQEGLSWISSGTGAQGTIAFNGNDTIHGANKWTIIGLIRLASAASTNFALCSQRNAGSGGYVFGSNAGVFSFYTNAAWQSSGITIPAGLSCLAINSNGDGTGNLVINGVAVATSGLTTGTYGNLADLRLHEWDSNFVSPAGTSIPFLSVFAETISTAKLIEITRDRTPWKILEPEEDYSYFATAGGGTAALAGTAAGVASATGALTTAIPIMGAAAVVSTASGALSTSIPFLGDAVVTATASGDLSAQIKLDGTAIAQALASAGLTTAIPLAGGATAQATATGTLVGSAALDGAAQALATAAGSLTAQIVLSGAAIAQALATGTLTAPGSGLAGAAAAQASSTGQLITGIPLIGNAQAYATAGGGLTTIIPLAGAAASVSSSSGDLTVAIRFSGTALAAALASGQITTQIVLSGAAVSLAAAAGVLTGGSAVVDNTWLIRPRTRLYLVTPKKRTYKGTR